MIWLIIWWKIRNRALRLFSPWELWWNRCHGNRQGRGPWIKLNRATSWWPWSVNADLGFIYCLRDGHLVRIFILFWDLKNFLMWSMVVKNVGAISKTMQKKKEKTHGYKKDPKNWNWRLHPVKLHRNNDNPFSFFLVRLFHVWDVLNTHDDNDESDSKVAPIFSLLQLHPTIIH